MGRRWIAVVTVVVGVVVAPATGAAGGGAVFEFGSEYFVPGDQVKGTVVINLNVAGDGITNNLGAGPFYAYLVRSRHWDPSTPGQGIRLGQIEFGPVRHQQVEATIAFALPEVKPGSYSIYTSDQGGSVIWIGDLVGGWFNVVATREEIPLRQLEDRLTDQIRSLRGRLELFRDRLVEAETEVNNAVSDAQLAVNNARDLESDVKALQAELARLQEDEDGPTLSQVAGWVVAGLVGGVAGALTMARRRRPSRTVDGPTEQPLSTERQDLLRPEGEAELVSSGRR
jgi:hypothetical protein